MATNKNCYYVQNDSHCTDEKYQKKKLAIIVTTKKWRQIELKIIIVSVRRKELNSM